MGQPLSTSFKEKNPFGEADPHSCRMVSAHRERFYMYRQSLDSDWLVQC
jgi:hypothetical protein